MIKFILALGVASAALAATPQPAEAQARGAPRGSYQQSCTGAYVNQGRLYADCRDERGRMRETSIELARCSSSDIGNNDGLLVCHGHRGDYEDRPGGGNGGGWGGGNGGGASITFYADADYRGASTTITSESSFLSMFNDRASSARVRGSWEVCEDARFGGRCERISGDVRNFADYGLNDRISSVRPSRGGGGGWGGGNGGGWGGGWGGGRGTITVYRDANFSGGSETLRGEIADLSRLGLNDAISSFRLNGRWEACTDANFGGQCQVFDGDVRNLSQYYGFNDRISSLRPVRGGWGW